MKNTLCETCKKKCKQVLGKVVHCPHFVKKTKVRKEAENGLE